MILSKIILKGFRNFKYSEINLCEKCLIIGANDVGKTNLLWAVRLLLDRSLSDYDIEPQDTDFYAFEETNEFEIQLHFTDITEDFILAKLQGDISDADEMLLLYNGHRNKYTNAKSYKIHIGPSLPLVKEIEDRYYRKVLNIKYISSRRDFYNYINREKNNLFELAKANRTEEQIEEDDSLYSKIQSELKKVDSEIPKLNYISSATDIINTELAKLSLHHATQRIVFDAYTSNADNLIKNVSISSKNNDQNVLIGGDERLNQIYLSLWAARNEFKEEEICEFSIFCIEEPEAHLHPHQQRKLAEYLNKSLKGQVILTSHSPQILSEFSPNSIVRLFNKNNKTTAASNGCSSIISDAFNDFGYRMSIIPAEAFFANAVLLIEGPSEEIFYKTLAKKMDIDLDKHNISILMVDGVGFGNFLNILNALEIDWVLRTDNDIFKIPKKDEYVYAGILRGISCYRKYCKKTNLTDSVLEKNESLVRWSSKKDPEPLNEKAAKEIIVQLEKHNIFLSFKDLENDIIRSEIKDEVLAFFNEHSTDEAVAKMQNRKAINLYDFLKKGKDSLDKLSKNPLANPLIACKLITESHHNGG